MPISAVRSLMHLVEVIETNQLETVCGVTRGWLFFYFFMPSWSCVRARSQHDVMADIFAELFLKEDNLKRVLVYLCKGNSESSDPITDALATMLGGPVQFCVGRFGLVLFKDGAPYPFTMMSQEQRQFLYEIVRGVGSEMPCYGPLAVLDNPLTFTVENERILFHTPKQHLDPKMVFRAMIELIHQTRPDSALLTNLLVQRLGSRVSLSRETLAYVHQMSSGVT